MNLLSFLRLIFEHAKILIAVPLLIGVSLILFLPEGEKNFTSSTRIYTGFASGFTIGGSTNGNFFAVKTKFDNLFETIESRNTKREICLKLVAYYLHQDTLSPSQMTPENQEIFYEYFTEELIEKIGIGATEEETVQNLNKYANGDASNEIYYLLNSTDPASNPLLPLFSIPKMGNLLVSQEATSDLITIQFASSDPGVCHKTLLTAIDVVMENVKEIKSIETNDVVAYYIEATRKAKELLNTAEDDLGVFLNANKVINYYEETKYLTERKEDFKHEFQREALVLAAQEAKLVEMEEKMSDREMFQLKNGEVLALREKLAVLTERIALIEIHQSAGANLPPSTSEKIILLRDIPDTDSTVAELSQLKIRAKEIEKQLKEKISELFAEDHRLKGALNKDVALIWIETAAQIAESAAKVRQYRIFEQEFDVTFESLSKLGSRIKRMERKIDVLEREYITTLSDLNDAKMRQQSISFSDALKVVDHPYYPLIPEKSKRKLIIIVGGLAGFILILALIILMDYLDQTIQTPERLEKFSELDLIGGLPILSSKKVEKRIPVLNKLVNQMINEINLKFIDRDPEKSPPMVIAFCSAQHMEGKTFISELIAQRMRFFGDKVLALHCGDESNNHESVIEKNEDNVHFLYPENIRDVNLAYIEELTKKKATDYKYVFLELPELVGNSLPVELIRNIDLSIFISKANRNWTDADKIALDAFSKITRNEIKCLVNGVKDYDLESIIGDTSAKRGKARTWMLKIASLNFKRNTF